LLLAMTLVVIVMTDVRYDLRRLRNSGADMEGQMTFECAIETNSRPKQMYPLHQEKTLCSMKKKNNKKEERGRKE